MSPLSILWLATLALSLGMFHRGIEGGIREDRWSVEQRRHLRVGAWLVLAGLHAIIPAITMTLALVAGGNIRIAATFGSIVVNVVAVVTQGRYLVVSRVRPARPRDR